MNLELITDSPLTAKSVAIALNGAVDCTHLLLDSIDPQTRTLSSNILIDATLTDSEVSTRLFECLNQNRRPSRFRVVMVDRGQREQYLTAGKMGATHILSRPASRSALLRVFFGERIPQRQIALPGAAEVVKAFESNNEMFGQILSSSVCPPGTRNMVNAASQDTIAALEASGLSVWIAAVKRHHNATFRHCLLVNGIAVAFAQSLGFSGRDVLTLSVASAVHDIGKARTPLDILDKLGTLTAEDITILERHPSDGAAMLRDTNEFDPSTIDAVHHHHEYLDGSGYPDGLSGADIPDLTRLITVVDIFAALIEERSYKMPMSSVQAYDTLLSMEGKLERSLVTAFAPLARAVVLLD